MTYPSGLRSLPGTPAPGAATATSPIQARQRARGEVNAVNASAIYEGWVMHRRLTPRHHRFKYSVFALLLDLDELPALDRSLRLFKYNRHGLFSFQDRDHGPIEAGEPHDLRRWLDSLLADAGITARGTRQV